MKQAWMIVAALSMCGTAALADTPVSEADAQKIRAALQAFGCSGGKMEQETEGTSVYEVDDAKCRDGQYDIKLDKDFKIVSMTRD
jgi:hypothetical protein